MVKYSKDTRLVLVAGQHIKLLHDDGSDAIYCLHLNSIFKSDTRRSPSAITSIVLCMLRTRQILSHTVDVIFDFVVLDESKFQTNMRHQSFLPRSDISENWGRDHERIIAQPQY